MGELSRLSELTRFAELTRFVYLFPIILSLRLHGKRVVPLSRDPACGLPRNSLRRDENCHVITFCRVGPARRGKKYDYVLFIMAYRNNSTAKKNSQNSQAKKKTQATSKFKWSEEMMQDFLDGLLEYKTQMEFNNSDFNADKNKQYEAVRAILASKYTEDTTLFVPKKIKPIEDGEDHDEYLKRQEDDKLKIRKGYSRVLEKIKALRQKFSTTVTSGRRSGSGKMVMEFYDLMILIWGGASSTKPLSFGAQ